MSRAMRHPFGSVMSPRANPNTMEVWKYVATSALSIVLAGAIFVIKEWHEPKGITLDELRQEMPGLVMQNNPYVLDQKDIASHLSSIDHQLTVISDRQQQQASDIAVIAAEAKVTAHPVRDPIPR